jgi:hypothetical protein
MVLQGEALRAAVEKAVNEARITDIHTHIYPGAFGGLLLWGIDELLTYHYLVAETFRYSEIPYESFWKMSKREQADRVWKTLFIENSPVSEACRGVLTVLEKLGLDTGERDLNGFRRYFESFETGRYIDKVFELSGVKEVVMTNDPFDDNERPFWLAGIREDQRFKAALRIDGLLMNWNAACSRLKSWGYDTALSMTGETISEVKRFLRDWALRMKALYMAVSLPPGFKFPEQSARSRLIEECVMPVCRELGIPFAMMIGVKKLTNQELLLAGDSVGRSDIDTVEYLCANYPGNKFIVTMLSRENQHELCVAARKFRNLLVFGCWWFLNNPSLIDEITRMRLELLGLSFVPQHSDARVLDQLIYKWAHSRSIISGCLYDKYRDLAATGWRISEEDIGRDVRRLFGGGFWEFLGKHIGSN